MDKAYLSIDLDYWLDYTNARSSGQFFKKVFELNVPILAVIEHEELLNDINESNARILYNVDYHSDICADKEIKSYDCPEDGTWVNFIDWRKHGTYHWICPDIYDCYTQREGTCCGSIKYDPFERNEETAWNSVEVSEDLKIIEWNKIERVGICLSPCYIREKSVRGVTKKLGLSVNDVQYLVCNQPSQLHKRTRGVLAKIA